MKTDKIRAILKEGGFDKHGIDEAVNRIEKMLYQSPTPKAVTDGEIGKMAESWIKEFPKRALCMSAYKSGIKAALEWMREQQGEGEKEIKERVRCNKCLHISRNEPGACPNCGNNSGFELIP